ncbi:AEC family transporter [Falsihalocynthiibacter sp. SS001]|uniref:AEC family transporter n=1 Tax=Falsihalocynthiibacter sp. SS001 TaxID=3349698 RepID=UPI0036D35C5D
MQALIDVILPVFIVIGFGYLVVWRKLFSNEGVDALMKFTQHFAIPCLLFKAISTLDISQGLDWRLLASFYGGATTCFLIGLFGARILFGRPWEDCVAIGFCGLFSNSLLLGLPITERAYGTDALEANYAIIAVHSPFCYGLGITVMEIVRNRGASPIATGRAVLRAMFRNALVIGIALGFIVNISGINPPQAFNEAVSLISRSALPAALFALGGVLYRYRPEGDMRVILFTVGLSLLLHPIITYGLARNLDLTTPNLRSAVLTASMAPGVNAYVFANMYGVAKRVAASTVLIATALSLFTIWVWLGILP